MMNNNFNNGAANNNNNSNNGGFIMAQGTLTTMEAFAGTVKTAMEAHYGEGYRVTVQDVNKNNGLVLTGIVVSVSVTALMLALTVRLYYRYHTLNLDEMIALAGKEEV